MDGRQFINDINMSNAFPESQFPPSGYNDNNFNRTAFPSNMFPMSGGMNGNPMCQFNPISTNTFDNMNNNISKSKFTEAYRQNESIIEKQDYTNKSNIIHNNIANNILDEHIVEYRIMIDSLDRDLKYYPNPFSYVVKFNPNAGGTIQTEEYIDYKNKSKGTRITETKFDGAPNPVINKDFRNVKYIKLENVILPQYSQIKKSKKDGKHNGDYEFDESSRLVTERFVNLVIDELDCDRVYTTYDNVTRFDKKGNPYTPPTPFALIVPDKLLGSQYYAGTPYYGSKIYKNSLLGNITQLTIQFYNSEGELLKYSELFTYDDLQEYEFKHGTPLSKTDLRHPCNKKVQNHVSLIFGIVESQVNTNTKFEY